MTLWYKKLGFQETKNFKINKEYVIDFAIGIEAKKDQEISFDKVVDFIIFLREIGYPIYKITADSAANMSAHTLQQLRLQGFDVDVLSVDRTRDPYIVFQRNVSDGRVVGPRSNLLIKELLNLKDNGDKIDHPITCSKDIADGACGSFWSCFNCDVSYIPFQSNEDFEEPDNAGTFLEEVRRHMKQGMLL